MKNIALFMALLMLIFGLAACAEQKNPSEAEGPCEHVYDLEVLSEATCTQAGTAQYTCTRCGACYTADIPALGHETSGVSCTEVVSCSICDQVLGDASGHEDGGGFCVKCGINLQDA